MENAMKVERKHVPPYLPYKTFKNFIEGLRVAMPGRIDRSLMGTMSGAMQSQVLKALEYLDLVSPHGLPSERLNRLVNSEGPDRQKVLREILLKGYPFLFEEGFNLQTATARQLEEQFSESGVSGDTIRKSIAFFLAAAKDADLTLSPFVAKKSRGVRKGSQRARKPASIKTADSNRFEESAKPYQTEQVSWTQLLLSKFPSFDPAWPDDVKSKWFDAFGELMKRGEEQEE
ncbi:MAG: DUF5343 domain-containing protein [Nitrospinae bacterium]|nr:DUF5343 domain-containing protein [Nitrospinota bacterium]